jgi:very-short-patch-repair endonuclease
MRSSSFQSLLVARAAEMRRAPTTSEALLWEALKGSKLGVAFRRQVPIGRYIVDFLAPSIKLVVEVDGGYHAQRVKADARRDRDLRRAGYRVLRVSDQQVILTRFRGQVDYAAIAATWSFNSNSIGLT